MMASDSPWDGTYLSFGGGVQSTALMILSALGERGIPRADAAIFADTQGELPATYEHINRMQEFGLRNGLPLHVTTKGNLEQDVLVGVGQSQASIPAFIKTPTGRGVQRRLCTYDYKLMAIQAKTRELLGLRKGARAKGVHRVRALMGISFDEAVRMKPSKVEWIENHYPLVEGRLTREDCKRIIAEHGFEVPPRSSCYFCPYHRDRYWAWLRKTYPDQFQRAVEFDRRLRTSQPGLDGEAYLHDSLVPLDSIDFDPKQMEFGFINECEGFCGV